MDLSIHEEALIKEIEFISADHAQKDVIFASTIAGIGLGRMMSLMTDHKYTQNLNIDDFNDAISVAIANEINRQMCE